MIENATRHFCGKNLSISPEEIASETSRGKEKHAGGRNEHTGRTRSDDNSGKRERVIARTPRKEEGRTAVWKSCIVIKKGCWKKRDLERLKKVFP